METLLEAASVVLENGGTGAMAERALTNLASALDHPGLTVVWRLDLLLATERDDGRPVTVLRPVRPVGLNLVRTSEVAALSERAVQEGIDLPSLQRALERIKALPFPYSRWVMALAAAGAGAAFARTMSGDTGAFLLCAFAAAVGQLVRGELTARGLTRSSTTFLCALLSGLIAAAGLRLGFSHTIPAVFMASIIYAVPGVLLINGFLDLLSERFLYSGLQRLAHAGFLFLILAIAVAVADSLL